MAFKTCSGLWFDQSIETPDGGRIIAADWAKQPSWSIDTPLHFWNHAIFRLDKEGNVCWQVRRDEGARTQWAQQREKAEAENRADYWTRNAFLTLVMRFADGTTNANPATGLGPDADKWVEGATMICKAFDSMNYELDVNTGVALNKTPTNIRPW